MKKLVILMTTLVCVLMAGYVFTMKYNLSVKKSENPSSVGVGEMQPAVPPSVGMVGEMQPTVPSSVGMVGEMQPTVPSSGMPVIWASSASTIQQVANESDLIVRAIVKGRPVSRIINVSKEKEGDPPLPDYVANMMFSDTKMEVLETYKGSSMKVIEVMQTGGERSNGKGGFYLEGDPIFTQKEEVILFLKDISGDNIHAKGRNVYLIVNPAGRYQIHNDGKVTNFAESPDPSTPKTVDELINAIKKAVN